MDIILPARWEDATVEEVDLELDILRHADGTVCVRDEDKFERVRREWNMPDEIALQATAACEQVRTLVEQSVEPFGKVGVAWLSSFINRMNRPQRTPVGRD